MYVYILYEALPLLKFLKIVYFDLGVEVKHACRGK